MNLRISSTALSIASLYIPTMVISFGQGMVIPTVPALAEGFEISPGLAAQVITANAVGRFVSLIPGGVMVDRFNPRLALILGPLMIFVGAVTMFVTPFFVLVLGAQFLTGSGDSLWLLGREMTALNLVRANKRGRLMSGFMGTATAGLALGPLAGGIIVDSLDLRAVFLAYAVLALAVLVVATLTRYPSARKRTAKLALFQFGGLRQISPYYRLTYIVLVFATFCMILYRMSLNSAIPLYVGSELGFSSVQVGSIFGVSGFFVLAMIIPAGFIMDKVGRKWATVPSAALPAVAFLAFPFANTMPQLYALAAVVGIANGLALGSLATSTYDVIPAHARGGLQALRRTIGEMGAITGPLIGGIIANTFTPGAAFFVYAPLFMVAALLLAFVARESLVKAGTVKE